MKWLAPLAGILLVSIPSLATAHVVLVDPAPRSGENGLTAEPCGDVAPTANPTVLQAGSTINVAWTVGQPHGGSLRIDFAFADDMGFDDNILLADISDEVGEPESVDVVLPDMPCEACTLRIIQINPDEAEYVSCADVVLEGAQPGTGSDSGGGDDTSGGGAGSTGDAGSSGGGDMGNDTSGGPVNPGDDTDDAADDAPVQPGGTDDDGSTGATSGAADDDEGGGCSCRTTGTAPGWVLMLGFAGLALRRRD